MLKLALRAMASIQFCVVQRKTNWISLVLFLLLLSVNFNLLIGLELWAQGRESHFDLSGKAFQRVLSSTKEKKDDC